jgi:transposase
MAPDSMRVRLHLRLIGVLTVLVDTSTRLEVEVASTRSWSRCPFCGFKTRTVHDTRHRKIRDLPVSGRRTTLVWIRRRFVCANCDERHLEHHPEFEGGLTSRLARQLVADAKAMSIRAVVRRHQIGWHQIQALVDTWSTLVAAHRRSRRCRVLLIDETSMRKRHRYVTVLQDGDTGQILAMIAHRNAAALASFFIEQGPRWCRGVRVVVTDGSKSYRAAIDTHLSQARHVLDRFHVVRWFAAGLTLVRRDLQRREPRGQVTPAFDPDLFRARFALLQRADHLSEHDQARLDQLFETHPRLKAGWDALQELYGLYLAEDRAGALAALDRFTDLYATGTLGEFHDIVTTILNWADEILDWHDTGRPSNGRIEGTNNLLQVLRRVAHGFTNVDNYAARGLLVT